MRVYDNYLLTGGGSFIVVVCMMADGKMAEKCMGCRKHHIFISSAI